VPYRVEIDARTGPAGLEPEVAADAAAHVRAHDPAVARPEVVQDPNHNTIGLRGDIDAFDAGDALRLGIGALARAMVACGLSATNGFARLHAEPFTSP
jgi:hypothetical protein